MLSRRESLEAADPHRWMVFGIVASVYFLVYFHRVSTSVLAPDLMTGFKTNATALGFMSSMYFYLYAVEQPVVGYFSDRLGPRRVIGFWSLAATLGCLIFSAAPSIEWAAVGRALIGLGVGGVYVPSMKAFSQWFRKGEFATMTGLLLASGNLGAMVATTPLAWMAGAWGWRPTFLVIGGITLGLALSILLLVRDHHDGPPEPSGDSSREETREGVSGTSAFHVLASPRFWILGAIFFGMFGPAITLQGLWATPFLMVTLHMSPVHASTLNMIIPLGYILGAPLFGRLADRVFRNRTQLMILLLSLLMISWIGLTFGASFLGAWHFAVLLLIQGMASGGMATAIWTTVRETTPGPVFGITAGLLNPFPLLGMAILQGWTGAILDHTGKVNGAYPPGAYRGAFLLCMLFVAFCLVLCVVFRRRLSRPD